MSGWTPIDDGDALEVEALAEDPRRLAAVLGGDVREIARSQGAAWIAGDGATAAELAELARDCEGRPCAVIERPVAHAALLRDLLEELVHPRLLVLVPCSRGVALRLPAIAGGYPRSSMLVLAIGDGGAAEPEEAPAPVRNARSREAAAPPTTLDGYLALAAHRRALGDPAGAATALEQVAEIQRGLREHATAARTLADALALWDAIGDVPAGARCELRLGHFADRRAEPAVAARHYEAAIARYRRNGADPASLEGILSDLAAARAAAASLARNGRGEGPVAVEPTDT